MAESTGGLHEVHAAYSDARGKAMSASTIRLRWQARRIPAHTADQLTLARLKAIRDELRIRREALAR